MSIIFLDALAKRIDAGQMTIEQIPEKYRDQVQAILDGDSNG